MNAIGLVLAGGLARRMGGGDKPLRLVAGKPILTRLIERFGPQVQILALSANGDPARFDQWAFPVIPDLSQNNCGPLAGVLAGMEWSRRHYPDALDIVTVPADAPFLPRDLVSRLYAARDAVGADMAVAASAGRRHPTVALWPVALMGSLRRAVYGEGVRKVGAFIDRQALAVAEFSVEPLDPFFNINAGQDLAEADRLAAELDACARNATI